MKFGQTLLTASEAVNLDDPAQLAEYEAARDTGLAETRGAIDTALTTNDLDAIVSNSATTGVGARAGYPSVIVPSGYSETNQRPSGVVFLGTAWSEAALLAYAYDFEQATKAWRSPQNINPSLFRCTAVVPASEWDASCAATDTKPGKGKK